MASTLTNLNEAQVDEMVVAALRDVLPALRAFSTVIEMEGAIQNDVRRVPIATDPSAQSKTAGTNPTANGTVVAVDVTLSAFYAASWDAVEGKMPAKLFPAYWADKIAGGIYSLGSQVVGAGLALITAANYGSTENEDFLTYAPADFGQTELGLLYAAAKTKIKSREMSFGMNPSFAGSLLGNSNLGVIFATGGNNFVSTGVVPALLGVPSWMYGAFPTNSQNLGAAMIGKGAIAVAVAPPATLANAGDGDIIDQRIITEPDSGLSVLYRSSASRGGSVTGSVELLYGVAVGQDAVVRVRTSA
jgi:hypothetical protein